VAQLDDYAANLQKSSPNVFKHDLSAEYSIEATDFIPPQLLEAALRADSLVIIPHGIFHLLPWAALIHQGKRLFEYLPVSIFPNTALLSGNASTSTPRSVSLLGVSSYPELDSTKVSELPSTNPEIGDIAGIYTEAHIPVRGPLFAEDATEKRFWGLGEDLHGDGHLLHLSCHATITPQEPMNSGLLLIDSKLDASEVARKRLPFDEVVLSACSTGWRPTKVLDIVLNADEILGIPGAFLEAGAKSVLVSIPKAEGRAARKLVTHYHCRRVAGDPPLTAMRAAQEHMLASHVLPATWAGFALYSYV
jgi:CHAT domain-containing protein